MFRTVIEKEASEFGKHAVVVTFVNNSFGVRRADGSLVATGKDGSLGAAVEYSSLLVTGKIKYMVATGKGGFLAATGKDGSLVVTGKIRYMVATGKMDVIGCYR